MWLEDHGVTLTHLIRDRDAKLPLAFDSIFKSINIDIVKTPIMPANAFAELWIATRRRLFYPITMAASNIDEVDFADPLLACSMNH